MTDSNKLLICLNSETFAVDANVVAAVVETERFFMLPMVKSQLSHHLPGFIKGVITIRGDAVVVIDILSLLKMPLSQDRAPYKVAVLKKDVSSIGIYLGKKELSFLWKEELKDLEFKPSEEDYIQGIIDPAGKRIKLLDWQKIFEETQRTVSSK